MSVDITKGATVELVKTLSDDLRTKNDNTKYSSAGAAVRDLSARKADIDGVYETLTAGTAKNLLGEQTATDEGAYTIRKCAHDGFESNIIIGGTVAWNQIARPLESEYYATNNCTATWGDTCVCTNSTNSIYGLYVKSPYRSAVSTHRYLVSVSVKLSKAGSVQIGFSTYKTVSTANIWTTVSTVVSPPADNAALVVYRPAYQVTESESFEIKNHMSLDLTQMFGTTIADYIYSLEQANAGDGVAWVKQYFPNDYYAYDAGSLKSVEGLSAHTMTGFNQWDEQWEAGGINDSGQNTNSSSRIRSKNYIPVISNTTYYTNGALQVYGYDYDKNPIGWIYVSGRDGEYTTPVNCGYVRFRTTTAYGEVYHNDICINISGSDNGTYKPYEGKSYSLDRSLTLRGIPQLNSKNELSFNGDVYNADGTVSRKYGIVDLGTLNWALETQFFRTAGINALAKRPASQTVVVNAFCHKYKAVSWNALGAGDKEFGLATDISPSYKALLVKDTAYSDAASFKAAMSGVYLIYELATPTTETAKPFSDVQWCSTEGIEAFDTTSIVPVGHDTKYYANLAKNVAQTNGYYENMTVGNSEQFVSSVYEEDSDPYLFRTSGGSIDIGDREVDTIVGGTIAWNQLNRDAYGASNGTLTVDGNGVYSYTVTTVGTASYHNCVNNSNEPSIAPSHKVLLTVDVKPSKTKSIQVFFLRTGGSTDNPMLQKDCQAEAWTNISAIINVPNGQYGRSQISFNCTSETGASVGDVEQFKNFMMFDLTQMFGSTIADYIYSLGQATAGAGVVWFRKLFPKPYYEYNAGELLSVEGLQSHDTTGFNQWDEEWEVGRISISNGALLSGGGIRSKNFCPCVPNTIYTFSGAPTLAKYILFYDADKNFIRGNGTYTDFHDTSPSNAHFFKVRVDGLETYNHDVCINIMWDGERDGEYEPYKKNSYPLDSSLTLRGIPKLDVNNKLYYDGDVYNADGSVNRKYGFKVFDGSADEVWNVGAYGVGGYYRAATNVADATQKYEDGNIAPVFSNKYQAIRYYAGSGATGITLRYGLGQINVFDTAFTSDAEWRALLASHPLMVLYELNDFVTEQSIPYAKNQIVNDFGTEEYVTDSIVPVGHNTKYQSNLKAKLEMSPDSPSDNGDYIVRHTNGQNEYVPLVIPTELPTMPTDNGTYRLKVTVSNGTATLSWEDAS